MRILIVIFSWLCISATAQYDSTAFRWEELGDSWLQFDVTALKNKPKKTGHLILAFHYESMNLQLIRESKGKFNTIYSDTLEDFWYNEAKAYWEMTISGDTIYLPSQIPFKATVVTEKFFWDGKKLHHLEAEFTDDNWSKIERADSLITIGKFIEASELLETVEYPMSYYNSREYGDRMIVTAHTMALELFRKEKYKEAAQIMQDAMEYWDNGYLLDFSRKSELDSARKEYYFGEFWTDENYTLYFGDFGLFLYKAGMLEESIKVNTCLMNILPEIPGPCLQLADAYYDLGQKKDAASVYKIYCKRMDKKGYSSRIPIRAKQRQIP